MASSQPWWSRRVTARGLGWSMVITVVLTVIVGRFASDLSPLVRRGSLPLEEVEVREVFLASIPDDPTRVIHTTRRSRAAVRRDVTGVQGDRFRRFEYVDPERPGLPPRVLLTSRGRGARLFVPLAATDADVVLSAAEAPAEEAWEAGLPSSLHVRTELVNLYQDLLFAGLYVEMRFPPRPEVPGDEDALDYAMIVVQGNSARTTDFLLHPSAVIPRAHVAGGSRPGGDLRVSRAGEDGELVVAVFEDPGRDAIPLEVPVSLYDELGLLWGGAVLTWTDDRWAPWALEAFEHREPDAAERSRIAGLVRLHLEAHIEDEDERFLLATRIGQWTGG